MKFSFREGLIQMKGIQLDEVDEELRNSIWNTFYNFYRKDLINPTSNTLLVSRNFKKYCFSYWSEFLKHRTDTIPGYTSTATEYILKTFYSLPWNRVYDFIEFNIETLVPLDMVEIIKEKYIKENNRILERESSGYRIVKEIIVPITNSLEIQSIEDALAHTPFKNINIHLTESLKKLSDKNSPDYRNSIKESISAVETLCREMTGENTLGNALKSFEKSGINFHDQFKSALEKLYHYTNDKKTGIRHALLEAGQTPEFEEAKFMLVSCSALVNYLISKNIKSSE